MQQEKKGYVIVNRPSNDKEVKLPGQLADMMQDLYDDCAKAKPSTREKLAKLITKYPRAAMLYYLQSFWYTSAKQEAQSLALLVKAMKQFPAFVLSSARFYSILLEKDETGPVEEYFANNFDIGHHFPTRREFSLIEFEPFMTNVILFLVMKGRFDEARAQVEKLREAGSDDATVAEAMEMVRLGEQTANEALLDTPTEIKECTLPQVEGQLMPLTSNFPFLYMDLVQLNGAEIEAAIATQHDAMLQEVKHILRAAITHGEYCAANKLWSPAVCNALLVAPYLDSDATLTDILLLLGQPERIVWFWMPGEIENMLSGHFRQATAHKLDAIRAFLGSVPGNSSSRLLVAFMLPAFAVLHPGSRNMVCDTVRALLQRELDKSEAEEIEYELNHQLVEAVLQLNAEELMPLAMELVYEDMVDGYGEDDIPELQARMGEGQQHEEYYPHDSLSEFIEELQSMPADDPFGGGNDDAAEVNISEQAMADYLEFEELISGTGVLPAPQPASAFGTVPKNSPCPCGSGKQYKRCHGK